MHMHMHMHMRRPCSAHAVHVSCSAHAVPMRSRRLLLEAEGVRLGGGLDGEAERGEVGVRLEPVLQVVQRAALVELVRVRDAQREQRVEVVRVGAHCAAEAADGAVVLVRVGVRLPERLPRDRVVGAALHRGLEGEHRLRQLTAREELGTEGQQPARHLLAHEGVDGGEGVVVVARIEQRRLPRRLEAAVLAALERRPQRLHLGQAAVDAVLAQRVVPRLHHALALARQVGRLRPGLL